MPNRKRKNDKQPLGLYVMSSLEYSDGAKPLGKKRRFETVDDAEAHCKEVINERGRQNHPAITLCVLKVVSSVHFEPAPIEVKRAKERKERA